MTPPSLRAVYLCAAAEEARDLCRHVSHAYDAALLVGAFLFAAVRAGDVRCVPVSGAAYTSKGGRA